jgi:hypothetical protein
MRKKKKKKKKKKTTNEPHTPVDVDAVNLKLVVLIDNALDLLLKDGPRRVGPPVVQRARVVVLRALVVDAVALLVASDHADAAKVGRIGVKLGEERRLEDPAREVDAVRPPMSLEWNGGEQARFFLK